MRYVTASIACLCLLLGFAVVKIFVFGSTDQVGAIPLLLLFGAMILVWRAIVKRSNRA